MIDGKAKKTLTPLSEHFQPKITLWKLQHQAGKKVLNLQPCAIDSNTEFLNLWVATPNGVAKVFTGGREVVYKILL